MYERYETWAAIYDRSQVNLKRSFALGTFLEGLLRSW